MESGEQASKYRDQQNLLTGTKCCSQCWEHDSLTQPGFCSSTIPAAYFGKSMAFSKEQCVSRCLGLWPAEEGYASLHAPTQWGREGVGIPSCSHPMGKGRGRHPFTLPSSGPASSMRSHRQLEIQPSFPNPVSEDSKPQSCALLSEAVSPRAEQLQLFQLFSHDMILVLFVTLLNDESKEFRISDNADQSRTEQKRTFTSQDLTPYFHQCKPRVISFPIGHLIWKTCINFLSSEALVLPHQSNHTALP